MSISEILSKIKKRILYGATTLDGFIELCKRDDAPFINIQTRYFGFRDFYRVEYKSPRRGFSEAMGHLPLYSSMPIFDLERKKFDMKTSERVLEAAEKIERAGIKAIYRNEPINKSKVKKTVEYEKEEIKERESELGLK